MLTEVDLRPPDSSESKFEVASPAAEWLPLIFYKIRTDLKADQTPSSAFNDDNLRAGSALEGFRDRFFSVATMTFERITYLSPPNAQRSEV